MDFDKTQIECRKFYLIVNKAENLPNVCTTFGTRAYAEVSFEPGDKMKAQRTDVDKDNNLNPVWDHLSEHRINEASVLHAGLSMYIKIYAKRSLKVDKLIGEVHKTMKDLFDEAIEGKGDISLPIMMDGKETGGVLNISYSFSEKFMVEKESRKIAFLQVGSSIIESALK